MFKSPIKRPKDLTFYARIESFIYVFFIKLIKTHQPALKERH